MKKYQLWSILWQPLRRGKTHNFAYIFSNQNRDISREKLLEILHYHNKRENLLSSQPNVIEKDLQWFKMLKIEYITTRLEDEIYFQFKVEIEDIAAAYTKHGRI